MATDAEQWAEQRKTNLDHESRISKTELAVKLVLALQIASTSGVAALVFKVFAE